MHNEDLGFSEGEFKEGERERVWANAANSGKEYQKNSRLYFEFNSSDERNRAMKFLNKEREVKKDFDEMYVYFDRVGTDPVRPEEGMEIKFTKNAQGLREQFKNVLLENGFKVTEDYKTEGVDEVSSVSVEQKKKADVVEFPKKDDSNMPKAA